jgi:hypothetical protein
MPFRVEIRRGMTHNYAAMRGRLTSNGKTDAEIDDAFEAIARAHNAGSPPKGAIQVSATPAGYQRFGFRIFGEPITYHIRPPDLIVVDNIDP